MNIGQSMSQCPKASMHCLHQVGMSITAAGGAYAQNMVCCHCGQNVSWWQGGVAPTFHGPHAPAGANFMVLP
jgi:hypothetical protein